MSSFTKTYIKSLKAKASRYEEYEGGGFGIRVTPTGVKTWISLLSWRWDSNPRPADYKSAALPTELRQHEY